MATFSELANLSADVVAKVEDSKEARPAMRPYSGRNCYADPWKGLAVRASFDRAHVGLQR